MWYGGKWVKQQDWPATIKQVEQDMPKIRSDQGQLQKTLDKGPQDLQQSGTTLCDENGLPLPEWDPTQYGSGEGNKPVNPGDVWYRGKWVTKEEARWDMGKEKLADQVEMDRKRLE